LGKAFRNCGEHKSEPITHLLFRSTIMASAFLSLRKCRSTSVPPEFASTCVRRLYPWLKPWNVLQTQHCLNSACYLQQNAIGSCTNGTTQEWHFPASSAFI